MNGIDYNSIQYSNPAKEQERRRAIVNSHAVTLNGKPAKVSGITEPFAHVSLLSGALSVEYSWPTVTRIMSTGGTFKA